MIDPIYQFFFWTTLLGILLMDFYTFRPFFITFYGEEKIPEEAGHACTRIAAFDDRADDDSRHWFVVVGAWLEWSHGLTDLLARTPSLAFLGTEIT